MNDLASADISNLAKALAEQLTPKIPFDVALWDTASIAEYMKVSKSQVAQRIICQPTFPKSIRIPTANGKKSDSRAQPRWKAKEVIEWTEKHKC